MKNTARIAVLIAALALAGCAPASASVAAAVNPGAPQIYTTGDTSELVTTLPVTKSPAPYGHAVIFCIDLGDVPAEGEVLHVDADAEFTNNLNMNVNLITHVLLAPSCAFGDGTEITEENGDNCIPDVHHCTPVRSGALSVPAGNTFRFVILIAQASASYATATSTLKVEPDYGRLTVLRWR